MTINRQTLRTFREREGFSQADLAEKSKVSKKTISRIELGESKRPNSATGERLAKALGVTTEELGKPAGEREEIKSRLNLFGSIKLTIQFNRQTTAAYAMAQYQYGVSRQALFEMAPLFLAILAEGSLEWRKRKVEEFKGAVAELISVSNDAPHMAYADIGYNADDDVCSEEQSIEDRDIFGRNISSFNPDKNNPFADYLRVLCKKIEPTDIQIDPYGKGLWRIDDCLPEYNIAPTVYKDITGDDQLAHLAIEHGYVLISEIPDDLMSGERDADRIAWLASKIPDENRRNYQEIFSALAELDLSDAKLDPVILKKGGKQ